MAVERFLLHITCIYLLSSIKIFNSLCLFVISCSPLFHSDGTDGEKFNPPAALLRQSQQPERHMLPRQRAEDRGFSCSLLLSLPAGADPQQRGRVGVLSHPLQIAFYHLPEEYRCR